MNALDGAFINGAIPPLPEETSSIPALADAFTAIFDRLDAIEQRLAKMESATGAAPATIALEMTERRASVCDDRLLAPDFP